MRKNINRKTRCACISICLSALLFAFAFLPAAAFAATQDEEKIYQNIAYGAEGDDVLELQTRLKELGYYTGDNTLTPSVYDNGTQQAVSLFCKYNNISYSGSGVSASVQHIVFSDGAVEYTIPEAKASLSDKITRYMTKQVPVFRTKLPMYFLWICSVIVVILIFVLCVHFFVPNQKKLEEKEQRSVPQYWRKTMSDTNSSSLAAMGKLAGNGRRLEFQVHYNGSVKNVQALCKPQLTIGRDADCGVAIDAEDMSVSHSHCDLYYRGAVLMLRDHSVNGTYVNGRLLHKSECRVNSGDQITVGSHVLVIQF